MADIIGRELVCTSCVSVSREGQQYLAEGRQEVGVLVCMVLWPSFYL
ncbi:MAG: hypothetical protein ACUVX8_00380 [Candidatus Zipacnadales bacterium]